MTRALPPLLATLLLLLAAAAPARAAGVEERMAKDQRLDRPVSLTGERVYLGELLETASTQAGVPLSADDRRSPVSGVVLTARRRPASVSSWAATRRSSTGWWSAGSTGT